MADPSDMNIRIAEQLIRAITGQIDFVHALALATVGGVVAFALQVALHNTDPTPATRVALLWLPLLICGTALEVVSLILGGVAKGVLTSSIPAILHYDYSEIDRLPLIQYKNVDPIALFAQLQSICFFFGVVLLTVFMGMNLGLLR
jgi:hypothetical protein